MSIKFTDIQLKNIFILLKQAGILPEHEAEFIHNQVHEHYIDNNGLGFENEREEPISLKKIFSIITQSPENAARIDDEYRKKIESNIEAIENAIARMVMARIKLVEVALNPIAENAGLNCQSLFYDIVQAERIIPKLASSLQEDLPYDIIESVLRNESSHYYEQKVQKVKVTDKFQDKCDLLVEIPEGRSLFTRIPSLG